MRISNQFVSRFLASILASLVASGVFLARGQGVDFPADAELVESLLQLEIEAQASEFKNIRNISSDNIGSISAMRITKHGFSLMAADQIETLRKDHVIEYVVIRRIYLRDGLVLVRLSRVIDGRPCFSPAFSSERSFTYEFQIGAIGWVGRLVRQTRPFSLGRSLATKP